MAGSKGVDAVIVHAVIALAHSLHLEMIAEGVKTQEHASRLQALGCVLGRGTTSPSRSRVKGWACCSKLRAYPDA